MDESTPMFLYRPSINEQYLTSAVADVSLFEVPAATYTSGAVLQPGAAFVDPRDPTVLLPLSLHSIGSDITCRFNNNLTGVYRVGGIAQSIAGASVGHVGPAVLHYSYTAQYVEGAAMRQGYSGAPASSATGQLHSFARSVVAAVTASDLTLLLLDEGRLFDGTCFAGATGEVDRYVCFTPAECALAQAARILGTRDLRDIAYVGTPVPRVEVLPVPLAVPRGLAARFWLMLGNLFRRG